MAGAYTYFEHRDIAVADVFDDVAVAAGSRYEAVLIDETFPAGIQDGNPFFTQFEGSVTVDTDPGGSYQFNMQTFHTFADGSTYESPLRSVAYRLTRNADLTFGLSDFSSISIVPVGAYSKAQLEGDVHIRTNLVMLHSNPLTEWTLEGLSSQRLAVSFYQLNDGRAPTFDPPTVDDTVGLKVTIDQFLEAAGYDVRKRLNSSVATVESMLIGYRVDPIGQLVPRVAVQLNLYKSRTAVDVENEVGKLIRLLASIPGCYPEQEAISVEYPDSPRSSVPYVTVTLVCRGG